MMPCEVSGGDNLSVEKITGTGGQTAAFEDWLVELSLPEYLVPPGAEIRGSEAWCAWSNWLERVKCRAPTDYGGWAGYDDTEDHKAVLRALAESMGPNSELFTHLYREFYNDAVAELKAEVERARRCVDAEGQEFYKGSILRILARCQRRLEDYHVERLQQRRAARKLVRWFRAFPQISETGTYIAYDEITAT